jgi:hypothetical protein
MYSREEFEELLDNMVPQEVADAMNRDSEYCEGVVDLLNLREKARVFTIKQNISITHRWHKATGLESAGNRTECYWCDKCNIRASIFEHINCLSIISKVRDGLPTYSVHNEYLMYTCEQILTMHTAHDMRCLDCGVPSKGKTDKCEMMDA